MSGRNTTIVPALLQAGFGVVSVDLPCHVGATPSTQPLPSLRCWRERLSNGEDIFGPFADRVSQVITLLRPDTVAVMGVSRGAYAGAIAAAKDHRITRVVGIAPVTDLSKLQEFDSANIAPDLSLYYPALLSKRIFVAINADDQRVSTDAAKAFAASVGSELSEMPGSGHANFDHNIAVQWLVAYP